MNFQVGQLRKIASDKHVPAWIRIAALDRLAVIDKTYQVDITPLSVKVTKLASPSVSDLKVALPAVAPNAPEVSTEDIEAEKVLQEFLNKTLTRGSDGAATESNDAGSDAGSSQD